MLSGLSQVFLLVSDLQRSVHFYQEILGRAPALKKERHARFDLCQTSLTIHADLTPAEVAIWKVDPVPERRGWGVYLAFSTEDLEETYRKAVGIGMEILIAPQLAPWGAKIFLLKDPDGYLLEFSQRE